jgi:hypothetical protein
VRKGWVAALVLFVMLGPLALVRAEERVPPPGCLGEEPRAVFTGLRMSVRKFARLPFGVDLPLPWRLDISVASNGEMTVSYAGIPNARGHDYNGGAARTIAGRLTRLELARLTRAFYDSSFEDLPARSVARLGPYAPLDFKFEAGGKVVYARVGSANGVALDELARLVMKLGERVNDEVTRTGASARLPERKGSAPAGGLRGSVERAR